MNRHYTIEYFVTRASRYFSLIFCAVLFLWVYAGMPEQIAVHFDAQDEPDGFLPRGQFFYLFGGILLVFNILPILLIQPVAALPDAAIARWPNGARWLQNRADFNETFGNWMSLLPTLFNVLSLFLIKTLGKLNANDYHAKVSDFGWLLWAALFALVFWVFYGPVRLLFTQPCPAE
jgi:uncharacterized membrane protein